MSSKKEVDPGIHIRKVEFILVFTSVSQVDPQNHIRGEVHPEIHIRGLG